MTQWFINEVFHLQGFTVIAGFPYKDEKASRLKEESSGRLQIIQLDPTFETQIVQAVQYVKDHCPQGNFSCSLVVGNQLQYHPESRSYSLSGLKIKAVSYCFERFCYLSALDLWYFQQITFNTIKHVMTYINCKVHFSF